MKLIIPAISFLLGMLTVILYIESGSVKVCNDTPTPTGTQQIVELQSDKHICIIGNSTKIAIKDQRIIFKAINCNTGEWIYWEANIRDFLFPKEENKQNAEV